jgi:hypothetical protein
MVVCMCAGHGRGPSGFSFARSAVGHLRARLAAVPEPLSLSSPYAMVRGISSGGESKLWLVVSGRANTVPPTLPQQIDVKMLRSNLSLGKGGTPRGRSRTMDVYDTFNFPLQTSSASSLVAMSGATLHIDAGGARSRRTQLFAAGITCTHPGTVPRRTALCPPSDPQTALCLWETALCLSRSIETALRLSETALCLSDQQSLDGATRRRARAVGSVGRLSIRLRGAGLYDHLEAGTPLWLLPTQADAQLARRYRPSHSCATAVCIGRSGGGGAAAGAATAGLGLRVEVPTDPGDCAAQRLGRAGEDGTAASTAYSPMPPAHIPLAHMPPLDPWLYHPHVLGRWSSDAYTGRTHAPRTRKQCASRVPWGGGASPSPP